MLGTNISIEKSRKYINKFSNIQKAFYFRLSSIPYMVREMLSFLCYNSLNRQFLAQKDNVYLISEGDCFFCVENSL